jgi:hypothetical protein
VSINDASECRVSPADRTITAAGLPEKGVVEVVNASTVVNCSDWDLWIVHQLCSRVVLSEGY